jgi:hypothetical protein
MPGPYLQAALFCDRVLEERDGALSAIRIIDRQMTQAIGADVPTDMPPVLLQSTLLVMLKSGDARGRFTVRVRPEAPSGLQMPHMDIPVSFEGDGDRGVNLVVPLQLQLVEEGLYWFDVFLVDERGDSQTLLTRAPLRTLYQPQRPPQPPPS